MSEGDERGVRVQVWGDGSEGGGRAVCLREKG
jgi:hypothetical protein